MIHRLGGTYQLGTSPGSILDISKYRDTCERSISILHGIAILRYIEVSNDQTILGRYSYDPEYRRSILRYFRTDTAAVIINRRKLKMSLKICVREISPLVRV